MDEIESRIGATRKSSATCCASRIRVAVALATAPCRSSPERMPGGSLSLLDASRCRWLVSGSASCAWEARANSAAAASCIFESWWRSACTERSRPRAWRESALAASVATHSSSSPSSLSPSASAATDARPPARSAFALKTATLANDDCKPANVCTSCASNQAHRPSAPSAPQNGSSRRSTDSSASASGAAEESVAATIRLSRCAAVR